MNHARQTYLGTYGTVDTVDYMIQKCNHVYVSWKYWHAMKRHVDALSIVVAYDFYHECATEVLAMEAFGIDKKEIKVLDFQGFKVRCAEQGIIYSVKKCEYPGDKFMRVATKASKKRRIIQNEDGSESTRSAGRQKNSQALVSKFTQTIFNSHMQSAHTSRLCGDLTQLTFHECKMVKTNNKRILFIVVKPVL